MPLGAQETITEAADLWHEDAVAMAGKDDMVNNFISCYSGAFDTIWDCACNVRKLEEKKGA